MEEKSLPIKEDDKFFTRIMSKETSIANSSCRVYYGGACGSIPFNWETAPGTPKASIGEETSNLPPLTPPPSYYSKQKSTEKKKRRNSLSMSNILPGMLVKSHFSPSSSMSSSSSSSFSSWSSFRSKGRKSRVYSTSRSVVDDDDQSSEEGDRRVVKGFRGCYSIGNVKSKLLSIVGHGATSH